MYLKNHYLSSVKKDKPYLRLCLSLHFKEQRIVRRTEYE